MQRLGLHLTDRCQLDCDHCLRDPGTRPVDLELPVIVSVLDQARAYGIRRVSLTGGEPTLHPRFADVLDAVVAHGCTWDMVTNGKRFAAVVELCSAAPSRLEALRSVTFSLDGATEATHDSIRGKGSFRDVLGAMSVAAATNLPFGVQMAVNARNEAELENLGLLAAQLGAKHVSFAMTQPTGTRLDSTLFLPPAAWQRVRDRVGALSRALATTVVLPDGYPQPELMALCSPMRSETLHVDVEGRLSLCCLHSQVPGGSGREIAGPVTDGGLVNAHKQLLGIIRDVQAARLDALSRGELENGFGRFGCNWCLAHYEKPHWTESGAQGAPATRARWKGDRVRLKLLAEDAVSSGGEARLAKD